MRPNLRIKAPLFLVISAFAALTACGSAEQRAQSYYDQGVKLVQQGELVKASLEFRNALKIKGNFVPALYSLGQVEEQQGHFDNAAQAYDAVTEQDPGNLNSRVRLAYILLAAGRLDEALKLADQALALAGSDPGVLALKAAVALKLDNRGDAIRFSDTALEIDPTNGDALIVRAAERLLAADPRQALSYLDRANEQDRQDVGLQLFRMQAFQALGDKEGVEQVYLKLVNLYPKEARFRTGLAEWYFNAGKKQDAEKVLRQYALEYPYNTQAGLDLVSLIKRERGADAAKAELSERIRKGGTVFPYKLAFAELTFDAGNAAEAADQMRRLVNETTNKDDNIAARMQLARIMLKERDTAQALKLIDTVLTEDARNVDALTLRASIRLDDSRLANAIADLRAALNQAPQSSALLLLLAGAYERNGAAELADEQYAKAVSFDATRSEIGVKYAQFLLRYGRADQAETVLTAVRSSAPANAQVLTLLAQLKLNRQDWLGAQEAADTLRTLDAKASAGVADLISAAVLGGEAKYEDSARILESLVDSAKGQNQQPLAVLVQIYVKAGKPDKATSFLNAVLKSQPDNVQAHILLASLDEIGKRLDEAEVSYRAAVKADSDGVAGYASLAQFLVRTNRLPEAEKTLREGLDKRRDNSSLRLLLAIELELSGQYDAAVSEYEKMLEADPRSTIVANNLASLLSEHRTDAASLDRAFAIATRFRNSQVPQFLDTLGWVLARKGEYDQALPLLKSAAEKMPNVEVVQYHLGMLYKDLGDKDLAAATLQRALSISSQHGPSPQMAKMRIALDELVSAGPVPGKAN